MKKESKNKISYSMRRLWKNRKLTGFRFKERDVSDFVGKKFGKLTVIALLPLRKRKGRVWYCTCECGGTKEVRTQSLTSGYVKSCGCLHKDNARKRLSPGESGARHLYRNYAHTAKKRKIDFKLSYEEFKNLTSKNCTYCGKPPKSISKNYNTKDSYSSYCYNGLDRIDSSKGYTRNNVEPCCVICNTMKWTLSKKDFLKHIALILKVQRKNTQ